MNDPQMIDLGEITPEELDEASHYSVEIRWSPEDQIFIADVPELPGTRTHGATQAEAVEMAVEAAALWLAAARHYGEAIPEPRVLVYTQTK